MKYPDSLVISDRLANKVLMAHSIAQDDRTEDFLELELEGVIVFSYWRYMDEVRGYELVILLMGTQERARQQYYKAKFLTYAGEVLTRPVGEGRRQYFLENIKQFFLESKQGKILILGREAAGKTSIKRVIFEGKDPSELLNNPLKATTGLAPSIYSWLDLELGVFDTAGQRINEYLESGTQQLKAFASADIVIYVFDTTIWFENNEIIFKDINTISEIMKEEPDDSKLILFCHKIDLLEDASRRQKINEIKEKVENQLGVEIFFTSIYPDLIYELYTAVYSILSLLSKESSIIKEILEEKMSGLSKTMFFITNEYNNIVVQTMTPDFEFTLINYMHNLIANINQLFETMNANDKINHLILTTSDEFSVIMKHLEVTEFKLKNIVCISESLKPNTLIWTMGEISRAISKQLKF
jgi:GTPase SAR1 family protein